MEISKIIKQRRKELGLTMADVAKAVSVSEATVCRWESGDIANIRRDKIAKLAEILQLSPVTFITGVVETNKETDINLPPPNITQNYTTFPVIGEVAAGYNHPALEDWEGETVDVPDEYLRGRNRDEFFVLKVKGDSMYPIYHDGDKVLVLRQTTLNYSGQVGVILYDDELASLKKVEYKMGEDWLRMVPINPTHPTVKIEGEALEHCRILGIPRLLLREIED